MNREVRNILITTPAGRELLARMKREERAKASRRKDRGPRAPGESKAAKREERSKRAAEIRAAVFARAGDTCECCRARAPVEWHHLISGGERRHHEAVETTAALCPWCHVGLHKNRFDVLVAMVAWAAEHRYGDALRALNHRLAKLDEARRPAPTQAGGTKP